MTELGNTKDDRQSLATVSRSGFDPVEAEEQRMFEHFVFSIKTSILNTTPTRRQPSSIHHGLHNDNSGESKVQVLYESSNWGRIFLGPQIQGQSSL